MTHLVFVQGKGGCYAPQLSQGVVERGAAELKKKKKGKEKTSLIPLDNERS